MLSAVISGVAVAGVILSIQALLQSKAAEQDLKGSPATFDRDHLSRPTRERVQKNEDDRAARIALQAQNGDYDPGMH